MSTESGIPDYRGPTGALRRYAPMTYQAFVGDAQARHRYWARSYLGWRQISRARPNAGHHAVATLQTAGAVSGIITQNVDGLHQAAGARAVVELHGGLDRTICLACGDRATRVAIDSALREANPTFDARTRAINPDGDAELANADLDRFVMVPCAVCSRGPLKPDVVFFGETCRAKGWSAATSSFRARGRCSCSARRWRSCRVTGSSCARPSFRYRSRSSARARPARMGVRASASIRRLARSCRRWRLVLAPEVGTMNVMSRFDLTGRTAVVTGATRWAGPSFRPRPGRGGADIVAVGRDEWRRRKVEQELADIGGGARPSSPTSRLGRRSNAFSPRPWRSSAPSMCLSTTLARASTAQL